MLALDLPDVRILEDMVIDSIYNGLFSAKMDNKQQQIIVDYVSSRDFKTEDTGEFFIKLKKWYEHVEKVESIIENNLNETLTKLREGEKHKIQVKEKASKTYEMVLKDMETQKGRRECGAMKDVSSFQHDT